VKITARVMVTVEVTINHAWGPDFPVSQVRREASEGAVVRLNRLLGSGVDVRVVGVPTTQLTVIGEDD
jgi:hypothetical protein